MILFCGDIYREYNEKWLYELDLSEIIRLIYSGKKTIIEIDRNYFRPLDVNTLLGNASKARKKLKWKPKYDLNSLIDEMISEEIKLINESQ